MGVVCCDDGCWCFSPTRMEPLDGTMPKTCGMTLHLGSVVARGYGRERPYLVGIHGLSMFLEGDLKSKRNLLMTTDSRNLAFCLTIGSPIRLTSQSRT